MRRRLALLLALTLLAAGGAAVPAEETSGWEEALAAYLAARDPAARRQQAEEVRRLAPDAATLAEAAAGAWRWSDDAPRGAVSWERETADGVAHTIHAYVPRAYTPERAWPALLWLHGDVTREEDGGGAEGMALLAEEAEAKGFLLICPSTQNGAHWWMPNGEALVHGALRDLELRYRVDVDRVAAGGRSDGGSACYHLLAHHPDDFCCFIPFIGHPLVSGVYGGPTWTSNLGARPVYAVNGGRDRLYPAREVRPIVESMRAAGCRITWVEEPEAAHDLSFFERRWPEAYAFWAHNPRSDPPATVTWTTSRANGDGRRAWVEILRLDPAASSGDGVEAIEGLDVPLPVPRPRLGLRFDPEFAGPGLRVAEVEEETPAAEAGFEAGDVLLRAGEQLLADARSLEGLREWLAGHDQAEGVFLVRRGGTTLELRARPRLLPGNGAPAPADQGYDAKPGTVAAEIGDGNRIEVSTDGVGALRLHLLPSLVDFEKELIVVLDGREVFRGAPPQSVDHVLREAWAAAPGEPLPWGFLDLEVAPAGTR